MANSLLNKLQIINNSRERLANILTEKGLDVTSENGLPQLVENVNNLYTSSEQGVRAWDGVDTTPPESYFVPEINLDEIFENDTEKDNYSNVAIYLIKVSDYNANLPQNAIQSFTRYRYSDSNSSVSAVSTNQSPSHTWDSSKDIIGTSGEHYRYVIGYSNTSSYALGFNGTISPFALVAYKGTYTDINWQNGPIAPVYTEIKSDCIFTGNLNGNDNVNYSAKTFICNAKSFASFGDRPFRLMQNLTYIYITSDVAGTVGMYYGFQQLRNCYCYIKQLSNLENECIFREVENCTFIFDRVNTGLRHETSFNWNQRVLFAYAKQARVKIGFLNGNIGRSTDCNETAEEIELEIDEVNGYIVPEALRRSALNCKGIKIGLVHGYIGDAAFFENPLVGKITITKNATAVDSPAIGSNAFSYTDLEEIDFADSDIVTLADGAFACCRKLKNIVYGKKLVSIGSNVFMGCDLIKTVILPETVTTITSETFRRCNVENVVFGNRITSLPDNAFANTPTLKSITLGENINSLGVSCFSMTGKLTQIQLPEGIQTIPESCFYRSGVKKVDVLGSLLTINKNAFAYCEELEQLDISSVETFGDTCFVDTNFDVIVPATMTSCSGSSFYGVKSLKFEIAPTISLDLSYHRMDKFKILDLFYSLIPLDTAITLTISPSANNAVTDASRKFWAGISNLYVKENATGDGLEYCNSSDEGAVSLSSYVSNKNYTIS